VLLSQPTSRRTASAKWAVPKAFTNTAGQLRAVNTSGNSWLVEADTNGDGAADFALMLTVADGHAVTAGDFVL